MVRILQLTLSKIIVMHELVERLTKEVGITPEQAQKAIETMTNYVKEQFPMIGGAVDQMFGQQS
jgi:hypothetical protein